MRFSVLVLLASSTLYGQKCVPTAIVPVGQVSGQLDSSSCLLSDATAYISYQLVFPVRGSLTASATASATAATANLNLTLRDSGGVQLATGASVASPVEAGTYILRVNAPTTGVLTTAIPFTLQTGFTAEAGMLCSHFPLLGLNRTVQGTLGASGCQLPDFTPYEGYQINTLGSGTLTISVTSTAFTPTLTVRDGTGLPLATGTNSLTVTLPASTSVQLFIGTADNTGAYQVTTSFQVATAETCLARSSLAESTTDKNAITSTSCSQVLDSQGDVAYFNNYTLTAATGGLADLAVASTDFTPTIYLLDADGNQFAIDSGGGGNGNSEIRLQLNPGTYTVQVFSNYSSGGNYTLTYAFTAGSPQACTLTSMAPGDAPAGTLSASSCRTSAGLTDLYRIILPQAGTLNIDLITTFFMGQIAMRDTKDNLVSLNQDLQGMGDSHITAVLPAGTYTIAASAISGAGTYQLVSGFTVNNIPTCPTPQSLAINSGYIQTLGGFGCIGADGLPVDYYQFVLPSDGVVAAVMTSGDFPGDLTLTDSKGNLLRHDRSSYAPNDPLIVQFLKAGTYQLAARGASAGLAGLYQVTVLGTLGPRPAFCLPLTAVPLGSTLTGTLSTTSCQYVDGSFADIYPLVLSADTSVDIRLNSILFDAYLVLLDSKGNLVAQDDDSGGGTNSRLIQSLKAGTYFLVAKPFANYYSVGAYQLSVQPYVSSSGQ